ncbi:MAG: winged helix-turn-helix domain-containing protein [Promethearchaeota archaeon]
MAFHIEKKFNVKLSVRQTQRILHELGFTLQRPKYKFPKADPEKQKKFLINLKKNVDSLGENDVILFQDKPNVQFSLTFTRMYALKGQQLEVLTYSGRLFI